MKIRFGLDVDIDMEDVEEPLRRFCGVLWMVDLRKTADFMFHLRLICLQENSADRLALERE